MLSCNILQQTRTQQQKLQNTITQTRNILYITIHHKQNNIQYNKAKQTIKQYNIIT